MAERAVMIRAIRRQRALHVFFALLLVAAAVLGWIAFEYMDSEVGKLIVACMFVTAFVGSGVTMTMSARLPHRPTKMGWGPGLFVFTLLAILPVIGIIALLALRPKESDVDALAARRAAKAATA